MARADRIGIADRNVGKVRGIDEQNGEVQPGVRRGDSRLRAL